MTTTALAAITASCNLTRCCGFDSTSIPSILASLIHSPANVPQDVTPVLSIQRWNEPVIALETALEKPGGVLWMAFAVVAGLKARHHLDMPGMRPETLYGPPLTTHCTTLDGPATGASPTPRGSDPTGSNQTAGGYAPYTPRSSPANAHRCC
jgi:hypothetical protein